MTGIADKLALGTVQLGMPYGIANQIGQPGERAATDIVREAWKAGIRLFDTAQAYGVSEQILGRSLSVLGVAREARVVTKLDPQRDISTEAAVRESLIGSIKRSSVPRLWGVLLHRETQMDDWARGLGQHLGLAREEGFVEHLGVSVYSVDRALHALRTPDMDLLQVAASVFDRRMIRAGVFGLAAEAGKTVFVRSVYLQGLALMDPASVPARPGSAREAVTRFAEFCARRNVSRGRFAVSYVLQRAPAAIVLVGAESPAQVRESCAFFREPPLPSAMLDEWDRAWPHDDVSFINPQEWPKP